MVLFGMIIGVMALLFAIKVLIWTLAVVTPGIIYLHRNKPLLLSLPITLFTPLLWALAFFYWYDLSAGVFTMPINPNELEDGQHIPWAIIVFGPIALWANVAIARGANAKRKARAAGC